MVTRNTIQRQIVLDTVKHLANHPTADDIYTTIFETHPSISRGTVYRNLNILADKGEILKIQMPDSADRFDHNTYKHYHVKCMKCLEVHDVEIDYLSDINKKIEEVTGFVLHDHEIVFKGVCPNCTEKS